MSILNKIQQHKEESSQPESRDDFSLSRLEIELLLNLIRESNFKGEHVETLYTLVYKLQQQYISKQ